MKIKLNCKAQWEVGRGHMAHRSGTGTHSDRRTKRLNTRASRNRKAMGEQ
jgi:hypothetical protein